MKKITLNILLFSSLGVFAQQQIGNSSMESWDNVGQTSEEPTNWNSFKTGTGGLSSFGSQQVGRSTSIRSGASGSYCARIYAKSTLGVVANGLLTVGQVNMGSSTANSPDNYNFTKTADENFSEALTSTPDSIVFWVKYTPINASHQARVHAILHDSYDFRDPIDANSAPHTAARAELNYGTTGGNWVRKSVPFVYEAQIPAVNVEYILVTFATSSTPGGGSANDEVLLDDIELIYNSVGINEQVAKTFKAFYSNENGLVIKGENANFELVNLSGATERVGDLNALNGLHLNTGIYFLKSGNSVVKILVP
ncbi:MAG: hypothetical protein FGM14_14955 [Flavobacteriales bacterium]|nr:hypothetical protein [Flavobacteriales bacterium]